LDMSVLFGCGYSSKLLIKLASPMGFEPMLSP